MGAGTRRGLGRGRVRDNPGLLAWKEGTIPTPSCWGGTQLEATWVPIILREEARGPQWLQSPHPLGKMD